MNLQKARYHLGNLTKAVSRFFSEDWELPDLSKYPDTTNEVEDFQAKTSMAQLQEILRIHGFQAEVPDYYLGPSVTTYQIDLPPGFKLANLIKHEDDIARDLNVSSVRIIPSCHGKIGIEIENAKKLKVSYKELLNKLPQGYTIPIILGEDTMGNAVYTDMTELPHLLVAGATGSGKSIFLHSLICSILTTRTPDQVRLLMVDPKQVEFVAYQNVPHLLQPIASDPEKAIDILDEAISMMDDRFEKLSKVRARNLSEYRERSGHELPYVVIIIDEYADIMLSGSSKARKDVETKIARIAQKARAVGIHMVLATQKPISTVVTSILKANLQARAAFSVACATDSKVILDTKGAERLSGKGDMLFKKASGDIVRVQAPWMPNDLIDYITGDSL